MPYCPKCKGLRRNEDWPEGSEEWARCDFCLGTGFVPDPQIEALLMTLTGVEDGLKGIEDRLAEIRDVERSKT